MTTLVLGTAVAVNGIGLLLGLGYFATGSESSWYLALCGAFIVASFAAVLFAIVAPAIVSRSVGKARTGTVTLSFAIASAVSTPLSLFALTHSAGFGPHDLLALLPFVGVGVLNWHALRIRIRPFTSNLPNSSVHPTPASGRG